MCHTLFMSISCNYPTLSYGFQIYLRYRIPTILAKVQFALFFFHIRAKFHRRVADLALLITNIFDIFNQWSVMRYRFLSHFLLLYLSLYFGCGKSTCFFISNNFICNTSLKMAYSETQISENIEN